MSVYVERRGNSIICTVQVGKGKGSTRTQSFKLPSGDRATKAEAAAVTAVADKWGAAQEKTMLQQRIDGISKEDAAVTVGHIIEQYLESPRPKQAKTLNSITRYLDWWMEERGNMRVTDFRIKQMEASRDKLLRDKGTIATCNRYVDQMGTCWEWAGARELIKPYRAWPRKELHMPENNERRRHLSDDERTRLFTAAKGDPFMTAAFTVAICTGIRQDNLCKLEWKHIDFKRSIITLPTTKNGKPHRVHVPPSAIAALESMRQGKVVPISGFVFSLTPGIPIRSNTLIKRFKKLLTEAGIPINGPDAFHWHDFRRTTACVLIQNGASLPEVGKVLGHLSQAATARYAFLQDAPIVKGADALDKFVGG